MKFSRLSPEYEAGLQQFLDYAIDKFGDHGLIQCPCKKCMGGPWLPRHDVNDHLIIHGFKAGYEICWDQHGESRPQEGNQPEGGVEQMLHDIFPFVGHNDGASTSMADPVIDRMTNSVDVEKVRKLMDDADVPLYPGCDKMAKLEFLIRLYHAKCSNGFSNNGVNCILELLGDILPDDARIPKNNYEASKIIEQLGFTYTKIHACPNDCMLYWEGDVNRNECTRCGISRWKQNKDGTPTRVPQKLMWHFPLIPRLQKLFMSAKTSKDMRWHEEDRTKDDTLRHPADGEAWQKFNELHPDFAQEIRNVRLGLSCDGFNPFKHMNTAHSVWPVFIHVYNLPPWMCMKKSFAFMTVLIPGPIEAGNDIDVYLQPLIAELKQLWSIQGVPTFDALLNESFSMRAALLWTINDFPAYALMSGWSTKGELACPVCGRNTRSRRLTHRRSFSYMGHRRFLRRNHPYRRDARSFDGTVEEGEAPGRMSGSEVLQELDGLSVEFGKGDPIGGKKRKRRSKEDDTHFNWRKKSIFFDLPYWETNLLRHCLDVMHIEKNVCELLLATILNIKDKTKDDLNSRLDLKEWGIRRSLHPEPAGEQWRLPHACYVMNASERLQFLRVLENIKVPDGYSSNISKRVNSKDVKLGGLKTHDYHVLMQELIPIAIRRVLPKNVRMVVIRLCNFYRDICAKRLLKKDVKEMKARAVTILCDLEKIFPPSFFTVMMHLTVHLAGEVALGGPVFCRWMYPTERNIQTLKSYVRNMNRPEGSIAERYLGQECMDFCTMYLNKLETRRNRPMRNQDDQYEPIEPAFESIPQPGGLSTSYRLTDLSIDERDKAHRYVLFNCDVIEPYVR